jgi:hypothetical protein
MNNKEEFDVVIVGAGVAGYSCAYWLNKLKNASVAILDIESKKNRKIKEEIANLQVGSVEHLYNVFKLKGAQAAIAEYNFMESNLELIADELKIFQVDGYVNLVQNGSINKIPRQGHEMNFSDFEKFLEAASDISYLFEVADSDENSVKVMFEHEGTYSLDKFYNQIQYSFDKEKVHQFEKSEYKMMRKIDSGFEVITSTNTLKCKKVIFANGAKLKTSLPELFNEVEVFENVIYEAKLEDKECSRTNCLNYLKQESHYQNNNKLYYSVFGKSITDDYARKSFIEFKDNNFPNAQIVNKETVLTAKNPKLTALCGVSKVNPNILYLGAFNGQSKNLAFKLAQGLVERIEL